MNEWLTLVLSLLWPMIAGLLLGALFFGGLWWTVHKGVSFKHPALLFQASMLLRAAVTVAGFYFVGDDDWQRMVACLFGFVIVRLMVTRLSAPSVQLHTSEKERGHAADA